MSEKESPQKGQLELTEVLNAWARSEISGSITLHMNNGKIAKIEERKFIKIN